MLLSLPLNPADGPEQCRPNAVHREDDSEGSACQAETVPFFGTGEIIEPSP